jgi:hypothetical protein
MQSVEDEMEWLELKGGREVVGVAIGYDNEGLNNLIDRLLAENTRLAEELEQERERVKLLEESLDIITDSHNRWMGDCLEERQKREQAEAREAGLREERDYYWQYKANDCAWRLLKVGGMVCQRTMGDCAVEKCYYRLEAKDGGGGDGM